MARATDALFQRGAAGDRWGAGFALAVTATFALFGPALIDVMTASEDVRRGARDYLAFVVARPGARRVRLRL